MPNHHATSAYTKSRSVSNIASLFPSPTLWGTSYQANDPCEDRYASLTNVLLEEDTDVDADVDVDAIHSVDTENENDQADTGPLPPTQPAILRMNLSFLLFISDEFSAVERGYVKFGSVPQGSSSHALLCAFVQYQPSECPTSDPRSSNPSKNASGVPKQITEANQSASPAMKGASTRSSSISN